MPDTQTTAALDVLPPLAEAMTAADLAAHITALAKEAGADWRASTVFLSERGDYRDPNPASLKLEVPGRNWRDNPRFDAPTWPEAFAAARAWIATHATVHRDNRIRAMALAIIDLTDQFGRCDRAMLTRREFTGAEIDDLKARRACGRGDERKFALRGAVVSAAMTDWYERRADLRVGMVFNSCSGLVQLRGRVPGDGTQWEVANWCGSHWSLDGSRIEPGDLEGRPLCDPGRAALARAEGRS